MRKAIVDGNLSRFRRHRVRESLVCRLPERVEEAGESPDEQARALLRLLAGLSQRQPTLLALRYGAGRDPGRVLDRDRAVGRRTAPAWTR